MFGLWIAGRKIAQKFLRKIRQMSYVSQVVYCGNNLLLCRTYQGHLMYLDAMDTSLTPSIAFDGVWEASITKFVTKILKEGMSVVEIGANVGYYTVLMAKKVGNTGRVYAFEPDPATFKILLKNLDCNRLLGRVAPSNQCVTDSNGKRILHRSPTRRGDASITKSNWTATSLVEDIEVDAVGAGELLSRIGKVDLIKMDAEGSEPFIVEAASDYLRKATQIKIVMEFTPSVLDSPADLFDKMRSLGFTAFRILGNAKLKRVDSFEQMARYETSELYLVKSSVPALS